MSPVLVVEHWLSGALPPGKLNQSALPMLWWASSLTQSRSLMAAERVKSLSGSINVPVGCARTTVFDSAHLEKLLDGLSLFTYSLWKKQWLLTSYREPPLLGVLLLFISLSHLYSRHPSCPWGTDRFIKPQEAGNKWFAHICVGGGKQVCKQKCNG